MKRYALILSLVLALTAGFGCAKKSAESTGYDDGMNADLRSAIQQITDGKIYFNFDKFDIKPEYKNVLKNKAEIMKAHPSIRVRIEGNCDERGTVEYNLALGERRAQAAYDYLTQLGVNPGQMEKVSFGKENPAVQGSSESAWQQNRRDEFRVVSH
ncbi:MAG: peptidoglycan-associated lipoprotein Pal [Desulfovibrio sp.]|nr:peptidoglycan-associated lipoprotein Pal [Desulfovibrio sp.]